MANYYYVTIKSDKMTQEVANEILQEMVNKNRIRSFEFFEYGELKYNTRGLTDITEILNKYEFTYAYENMMSPDEVVMPRRSEQELIDYEQEAFDKVWLMRTSPCDDPEIEARRQAAVEEILAIYSDIPEEGYDDWACGFWNGVMATCRWALGDEEKDNLDT